MPHHYEVGQQFREGDADDAPVLTILAQTHRSFRAPVKVRGTVGPPKMQSCTAPTYTVQGSARSRVAPSESVEVEAFGLHRAVEAGRLTPVKPA